MDENSPSDVKKTQTPLGGLRVKNPELCRCEESNNDKEEDCGCAFGQCMNGWIF